jgi:epoxide hydrolase-like predicted phosphatase
MVIRAVVFDVGGVLERTEPPGVFLEKWERDLGKSTEELRAAFRRVDPDGAIETGGLSEPEYLRGYAEALGLSETQAVDFARSLWDWYCGTLDTELVEFVAALRPRYRTAILSNSADGARREEQRRYGFEDLVDTIVYSHEVGLAKPDPRIYALTCARLDVTPAEAVFLDDVPAAVDAARAYGMHAVLHRSTPTSIAAITTFLEAN